MRGSIIIACFFVFCMACIAELYSQDIYYVNRLESLYRYSTSSEGDEISQLNKGEIINIIRASAFCKRVGVQTKSGIDGWLAEDAISIKDSVELPKEITDNYWSHSYYLDVLRSGRKEYLFEYEPFWRDHFDKYEDVMDFDYTWNQLVTLNSVKFTNIVSLIYAKVLAYGSFDAYGNTMILANINTKGVYLLAHLSEKRDGLEIGSIVEPHEIVAKAGNTTSKPPMNAHLHITYYDYLYTGEQLVNENKGKLSWTSNIEPKYPFNHTIKRNKNVGKKL